MNGTLTEHGVQLAIAESDLFGFDARLTATEADATILTGRVSTAEGSLAVVTGQLAAAEAAATALTTRVAAAEDLDGVPTLLTTTVKAMRDLTSTSALVTTVLGLRDGTGNSTLVTTFTALRNGTDSSSALIRSLPCYGEANSSSWQVYPSLSPDGLLIDVSMTACGFSSPPRHVSASLYGGTGSWLTLGSNSIYDLTATSFRIYLMPVYPERVTGGAVASDAVLTRNSVDTGSASSAAFESRRGIELISCLDACSMVVLNGLDKAGGGHHAEATYCPDNGSPSNSVLDLMLVDSQHWRLMDSVRVQRGASGEVKSDHELIVSTIRYDSDPAAVASDLRPRAAPPPRQVRYRVDARGDDTHFDSYRERCSESLKALADEWHKQREAGHRVPVEDAWQAFLGSVHEAAADTLGVCPAGPPGGLRDNRFPAGSRVQQWKKERALLLRRGAHRGHPAGDESHAALQKRLRHLNNSIRSELRKQVRRRQVDELRRVWRLRRDQKRENSRRSGTCSRPRPWCQPQRWTQQGRRSLSLNR